MGDGGMGMGVATAANRGDFAGRPGPRGQQRKRQKAAHTHNTQTAHAGTRDARRPRRPDAPAPTQPTPRRPRPRSSQSHRPPAALRGRRTGGEAAAPSSSYISHLSYSIILLYFIGESQK